MNMRQRVVLTSVEEDFRRIGILPQRPLMEVDDPSKPREIPSPDPSTLRGLDDSEGEKSAHNVSSKQPKPAMGPDEDDAEDSGYDPLEDGGSKGPQKSKGTYHKVPAGKEASLKGEARELGLKAKKPYQDSKKKVHPKGKPSSVRVAQGLKPVKKIAGMKAEGTLRKAANLIEEVEGLLRGVQTTEEADNLLRSFRLVSENSALLADRLTEVSHLYETEKLIATMESLSQDAAEAYEAVESEIACGADEGDEAAAIANSGKPGSDQEEEVDSDRDADEAYTVPSPAPGTMEQAEAVLQHMVVSLMDALEAYDGALDDMGYGDPSEGQMDAYEDDEAAESGEYETRLNEPGVGKRVSFPRGGKFAQALAQTSTDRHRAEQARQAQLAANQPQGEDDDEQGDDQDDERHQHASHDEPDDDDRGGESDHDADDQEREGGEGGKGGFADRMAALRQARAGMGGGKQPPQFQRGPQG